MPIGGGDIGVLQGKGTATPMNTRTAKSFTKTTAVLKLADSLMPMTRMVVTARENGRKAIEIEDSRRRWARVCQSMLSGVENRLDGSKGDQRD